MVNFPRKILSINSDQRTFLFVSWKRYKNKKMRTVQTKLLVQQKLDEFITKLKQTRNQPNHNDSMLIRVTKSCGILSVFDM